MIVAYRLCGSGDIMFSAFYVIWQCNVIKGLCEFMGASASWKVNNPAKASGHRLCGSGNIVFLVVVEQDSTLSLIPQLLVISKAHGMSCSFLVTRT